MKKPTISATVKESINKVNDNLLNQSNIIKQEIAKNNKRVSHAIDYIDFLSTYKPKNKQCDSFTLNLLSKENEISIEKQVERTTLGNQP